MTKPRVVVFDLGNVLIEWDRSNLFSKLIEDPGELQDFLDNVYTMDENARLDSGTPLQEVADSVIEQHPAKAHLIAPIVDRWEEMLGPVFEGTVAILEELSANGVCLLALSNWGEDTFAMIEPNYPFLELFDGMVISGREGVVKPDREIFDILCERYSVAANEAVFIDDSPANIAAAQSLGFDALLFETSDLLRSQLIERELL